MKKWFAVMMGAVLLVMTACSSSAGDNGKVELTFWFFGSTGYEKLAEKYMKAPPM